MECLLLFQIFNVKMPFTPTATASSSFSSFYTKTRRGGAERKRKNKLKDFFQEIQNQSFIMLQFLELNAYAR